MWEGLVRAVVDGRYFLKEYLGEEEGSGVFLADSPRGQAVKVRLVRGVAETEEELPAHPHLVAALAEGETRIDGHPYRYRVLEREEEVLADVLAERPLTAEETGVALEGVLEALRALHARELVHGNVRPASIVAVGDRIKLATGSVRRNADPAAQREDIRQAGESVVEMLTQQRAAAAGIRLPAPFDEIVRASSGGGEASAEKLLRILHGTEPEPQAAAITAEPLEEPEKRTAAPASLPRTNRPEPQHPELHHPEHMTADRARASVVPRYTPSPESLKEPPAREEPDLREPEPSETVPGQSPKRMLLVGAAIAAVLLAILIPSYRSRSAKGTETTSAPAEASAVPPPAEVRERRPSPIATTANEPAREKAAPAVAAPAAGGAKPGWAVVVAAYSDFGAAQRRASQLGERWTQTKPVAHPPEGQGRMYMVVLASGLTQKEAERVRVAARSAGMPRDTYVTRLR